MLVQMATVSLNPMVQLRGVAVKSCQPSRHKGSAAKARWAEQNLTCFSFPILGFLTSPNTIATRYASMIPMADRMRLWSIRMILEGTRRWAAEGGMQFGNVGAGVLLSDFSETRQPTSTRNDQTLVELIRSKLSREILPWNREEKKKGL